MHEWSIAEGIIDSVLSFASEKNVKEIKEIMVAVGEISQLDIGIIDEAIKLLSKGTVLENTVIHYKVEPAVFTCRKCGSEWSFTSMKEQLENEVDVKIKDTGGEEDLPLHYLPGLIYIYMQCPSCGSRDFEIKSGFGVKISKIVAVVDK